MNKTTKVALCISLAGIGVFAWPHVAAAGKPAAPVVTFIAGDVSAAPQRLGGKFTATIDFAKHLAYPAGGNSVPEWKDILNCLETKNPITYDSLKINALVTDAGNEGMPINARLDFTATIDGVKYLITMNAFLEPDLTEITPTLNTYHWHEGRFAISRDRKLVVEAGCYGGRPNVDVSITQ